jgi:Apea-like HEPN
MNSIVSPFELIKDFKPELKRLIVNSVIEALDCIALVVERKDHIGSYFHWPQLSFNSNGFPSLSKSFSGPIDYTDAFHSFGSVSKPLIAEDNLLSFKELVNFVKDRPDLRKRFSLEHWEKSKDEKFNSVFAIFLTSIAKDVANRFIHINKTFRPNRDSIESLYAPIEEFIFSDVLNIDIIVPILFVKFNFDSVSINDNTEIRKIEDRLHLARSSVKSYRVSVHDTVVASATHALILKKWYVKNSESIVAFDILSNPRVYPTDQIDKFFGAIRLAKEIDTGYAQLMASPIGWARHFQADLPTLEGTTIRSYPSWFEDYYWNSEKFPELNEEDVKNIGNIYINLLKSREKSIDIAIKRLNQCLIRDNEEDSVLDATIALEALLLRDGNQEMTHKLAMRAAALSKLAVDYENKPKDVFKDIKHIYKYRSAIVHGSIIPEEKRMINVSEGKSIPANALAVKYLRFIIKKLIEYPQYRDPKKIDEDLLLNDKSGNYNKVS